MKERTRRQQLFINMTAQIISFASNAIISFFLTPYIIRTIGSEAYGFVGLANNFINYASIVTTALNSMAGRFITIHIHRNDYEKANKYFSSVFISNVFLAVPLTVISVFIIVFLNKIVNVSSAILPDVRMLWILLFSNFIVGLIMSVFSIATFSQNRLDLTSMRNIEASIIRVGLILGLFAMFKPSVWYLGAATFVCAIYSSVWNVYYTRKLIPFIKINKNSYDFKAIKQLISSGLWNSVTHISSILSNGLDLLITNLFITSTAMGTVSVAKTFPSFILSTFGMLASVFMPELTISYAKNDFDDIKNQLNSSIKLLGFFSCIPITFFALFGRELFALWVPTQDAEVLHIISLFCILAFPVGLPLEPLWNIFTVTNKVKQSSLFLLSNAMGSTLLVFVFLHFTNNELAKLCIIVGTSTCFSLIRNLTFLPMYGAKCLGYKLGTFYPAILKNLISLVLVMLPSIALKQFVTANSWIKLIACGVVIAVFGVIINYFFLLGKKERSIIRNKAFGVLKKFK